VCRAVIVAPCKGAPLSSTTVPWISEVVSWAYPLINPAVKKSKSVARKAVILLIMNARLVFELQRNNVTIARNLIRHYQMIN
jgi:hypothetical protein